MTDPGEWTAIVDGADPTTQSTDARGTVLMAGHVLNGIYKVERFIARGGMGEVFEGVNVETEERVAIKAIRNHLANDAKVVALFRKEARILIHIAHPAIVQYRVFARDPHLDLRYIVTDFVNGEPLTVHLHGERPKVHNVVLLARRLAAGLEAAHEHGAIHRDMSPDNVLLPDGGIERAKIIDFGIAKSLTLPAETLVGDGFAGKLGYVAPEQFGDFERRIGPWTDVYSTALVLLAYACGRAPAMGATLSEAVERRRARPDLADVPPALVSLFEGMLAPNPSERLPSMRAVLDELDRVRLPDEGAVTVSGPRVMAPVVPVAGDTKKKGKAHDRSPASQSSAAAAMTAFAPAAVPPRTTTPKSRAAAPAHPARPVREAPSRRTRRKIVLAVVPVAALAIFAASALRPSPETPTSPDKPVRSVPMPRPTPVAARAALIDARLAEMPCTWINARPMAEGRSVLLTGGASDPAALAERLFSSGAPADSKQVQPINGTQCGIIDALRPFRARDGRRDAGMLSLSSGNVSTAGLGLPCRNGGEGALDVTAQLYDGNRELALISLQPDGRLLQLAGTRADFNALARRDPDRFNVGEDGAHHVAVCYQSPGSAALVLIASSQALDLGLRSGVATPPPADLASRIAEQGPATEMQVFVEWAQVSGSPPSKIASSQLVETSGLPTVAARPIRPARIGEQTQSQALIKTADANRRELDRIAGLSPPRAPAVKHGICRQLSGSWRDVSALGRDQCIALAIKGQCRISSAMYNNRLLRRHAGRIQERWILGWRNVADDPAC